MKSSVNIYKKFLVFWICISLIISYTPAIAFAADDTNSREIIDSGYCGTYVTYTLYSDGEMVISGTGAMDDTYTGSTYAPWYSNKSKITKITIEDGVTSIGQNIFNSLYNLTDIDIPNSVTAIKKEAFSNCSNLKEVTLPENLTTLGSKAFTSCKSLESIIIPENIKGIDSFVFSWCTSLKEITLNNNITYIGEKAFLMCSSLDGIILPDSLTSIGQYAFSDCVALKKITIPDSVQSLTGRPFYNCTGLETITLPNNLTTLEEKTFYDLTGLKTVIFPENCQITSIGNSCFYGCTSLETISIPETVTEIGTSAFGGCSNLNSIDIPSNITIISDGTFSNCSLLTEVTIPASVNTIGENAFNGCSSLKEISLPKNIVNIKNNTFKNCSSLTDVKIPENVTCIGEYAFNGCSSLKNISLPNKITEISDYSFSGCSSLTELTIPDSVISIGNNAFSLCESLESINLPNDLTSVGSYAFDGCSSLKDIIIPNNLTEIKDYTFNNCSSLEKINLSNNITTIGEKAFYNCNNISALYIDSIENYLNIKIMDETFSPMKFYDVTLYVKNDPIKEIIIPKSVTSIRSNAFHEMKNIEEVVLHDEVISIGASSFAGCTNLESINLTDNINSIGASAFSGCTSLNTIKIPESLTEINEYVFSNCINIKELQIPENVKTVYKGAFKGCAGIEKLAVPANLNIEDESFYDVKNIKTLTITGTGSIDEAGVNANHVSFSPWSDSSDSLTTVIIKDGPSKITDFSFSNFTKLKSVVVPESITDIEGKAFYNTELISIHYAGSKENWINTFGETNDFLSSKTLLHYNCTNTNEQLTSHVESDSTCVNEGVIIHEYPCGTYYTETIDKLEHKYTLSHIVLPTCTEKGYTEYACICGDTYKGNYTDLIAHDYNDENICNVCGDIKITDPIEKIQISSNVIYMDTVSTLQLTAYIYPYNATIKEIDWTTSDNAIATVSQSGLVSSSFKSGKVTIKAAAKDGTGIYDEITLYIGTNHTVAAGNETKLSAKTVYSDVIWEIENPEILQITDRGYTYASFLDQPYNQYVELKALKSGTTKLYMKNSADNETLSTCTITVYTPINNIISEQASYVIEKGSEHELNVSIEPDDVDEAFCDMVYTSSNTDVLTVDQNGTITGVNNGKANITVTAKLGDASLVIPVSIVTYADSIELETNNVELDGNNKYFTIKHKILPEDSTYKSVKYKSNDENVALVDNKGKITAVGNGNAIITVTSEDNKAQAEVNVTVNDFVTTEDLIIEDKEIIMTTEGKIPSYSPKYVLTPENASNKDIVFEIKDPSIAEVDETGNIIPVSIGETLLTIKTKGGRFSESVPVKVIKGYNDVTYYSVKNNSGKIERVKSQKVYYGDIVKLYDDISSKGYYIEGWYQNYDKGFSNRLKNEYTASGDGTKHYIYINEQKVLMKDLQLEDDYEILADNTVLRVHFKSSSSNAIYDNIQAEISNESVLSQNNESVLQCNGNDYYLDFNINGTGKTNIVITTSGGLNISKDITIIDLYDGVEPANYNDYKVLSDKTAAPKLTAKYFNKDQVKISCPSITDTQKLFVLENSISTSGKWIHNYGEVTNNTHVLDAFPNQTYKFKGYICETNCDVATKFSSIITYKHTVPAPTFTVTNTSHTTNVVNINGNRNDYSKIYVYRSTYSNKNFVKVATIAPGKNSYTNTKLTVGKTYYYKVKGVVNGYYEESSISKAVGKKVSPATPKSLSVNTSGSTATKVKWAKVSGVTGYKIYRATSKTGTYKLIKTISKGSTVSYTNSKLTSNKTYYYKIRSYVKKSGKYYYSSYSTPVSVLTAPKTPTFKLTRNGYDSVKITVSKVSGAAGYNIYRATSKKGTYTKVATLSKSGTYVDTKRTTGKTYYYKVKAYNSKSSYSTLSSYKYIKVIPSTPSITLSNKVSKQVSVSWKSINGATGYQIYRATSKSGKYSKVATISSKYEPVCADKKVKKGKRYYYKIRAYVKKGSTYTYSNYSTVKSIVVK